MGGLSIGANTSRVLAKVVLEWLKEAYETNIDETQFGIRRNCDDAIFVFNKYNDKLIAVYIDLTDACDSISQNFMFKVLDLRTDVSHLIAQYQ